MNHQRAVHSDASDTTTRRFEGLENALTHEIIGAAQKVHATLGTGFTENTYHWALAYELMDRGIPFESEKEFEVTYAGRACGRYRADMVVRDRVIVELKAVAEICDEHKAQVVSYLKASDLPIALLLNFGASSLEIRRYDRHRLK